MRRAPIIYAINNEVLKKTVLLHQEGTVQTAPERLWDTVEQLSSSKDSSKIAKSIKQDQTGLAHAHHILADLHGESQSKKALQVVTVSM